MKIFLLIIFSFAMVGCAGSTADPADEPAVVYAAVLSDFTRNRQTGGEVTLSVIGGTTEIGEESAQARQEALRNMKLNSPLRNADDLIDDRKPALPEAYKVAMDDFRIRNSESRSLPKPLNLPRKYLFISDAHYRVMMSGANPTDNWKAFYAKYPESSGFIKFSAVGFDAQRKHAIIYVEEFCGDLCGSGDYLLLEKDAGTWKEVARQNAWTS